MRLAAIGVGLVLAACTEDIVPGAYLCGPEQLCPEGLACNGTDNLCVLPSQVVPFECNAPDPAGDDVPTAGARIDGLTCVSSPRESLGCLRQNDLGDWYQFDIPDNCVAVQIETRLTFPVAYERMGMQLSTDDAAGVPVTDVDCSPDSEPQNGEVTRCFEMVVQNGAHHAIGVVHSGDGDCGGACAFNRYTLQIRLATP